MPSRRSPPFSNRLAQIDLIKLSLLSMCNQKSVSQRTFFISLLDRDRGQQHSKIPQNDDHQTESQQQRQHQQQPYCARVGGGGVCKQRGLTCLPCPLALLRPLWQLKCECCWQSVLLFYGSSVCNLQPHSQCVWVCVCVRECVCMGVCGYVLCLCVGISLSVAFSLCLVAA